MKIRDLRTQSGIIPRLTVRWLMIAAATIFAFWPTWTNLWRSTASGTAIGYVFVPPLLCLIAAVGTDLRRGPDLPIHDRETDKIVGGIGLLVSLGLQALLMPRFAENYELMHIDVIAAWVFVWSAAVLMFGLRPVNRYWAIWVVPIVLAPLIYRTLATELGGTRFDYSIIMVLVASAATTIAVSRTWRRGFAGFVGSSILGAALVYYLSSHYPTAPLFSVQLLPALGSALLVGGFLLPVRATRKVMEAVRASAPESFDVNQQLDDPGGVRRGDRDVLYAGAHRSERSGLGRPAGDCRSTPRPPRWLA